MSSIVLSSSVRQNLLSLQSTASLLATTQNDLATGNKVNSALDNPTSFFTASALNNRAGDISNLLDEIGNGVQVLQAANTGITSLQSLVASAQSIANQVLQTPIGYSAKSNVVATAITGATANNLLGTATGTGPAGNAVATGASALGSIDLTGNTNAQVTGSTSLTAGIDLTGTGTTTAAETGSVALATGLTLAADTQPVAASFTGTTAITTLDLTGTGPTQATATGTVDLTTGIGNSGADLTFTINGATVTVPSATASGVGSPPNFTLSDIETAINGTAGVGVTASDDGAGHLVLNSTGTPGAGDTIDVTGIDPDLGITSAEVTDGQDANDPDLNLSINGQAVTFAGGSSYTQQQIEDTINSTTGIGVTASFDATNHLVLTSNTTGAANNFVVSGLGANFGIADGTSTNGADLVSNDAALTINGKTVTFTAGGTYSQAQIVSQINGTTGIGVTASFDATNHLVLTSNTSGTAGNFTASGSALADFGLSATATTNGADPAAGADLTFTVNGTAVTLTGGQAYTAQQVADKINTTVTGVNATIDATSGDLVVKSTSATKGPTDTVTIGGAGAAQLGFSGTNLVGNGAADAPLPDLTFQINDKTVTLAGGSSYTAAAIATAINTQVGASAKVDATVDATTGDLVLTSTGTAGANDQVRVSNFSSGDATQLGFAAATETDNGTAATESIAGQTLTIASTGGGTATNITFGTANGQISTLNELNAALSSNNLQATIDSTGVLTITTSNNAASSTIGVIGGTATATTPANGTTPATAGAFAGAIAGGGAPVVDPNAQATRTGLVDQYNNILKQIDTTSQDSSFNGINLLQGDTLNLTFDETGKSTLAIKGVTFNTAGLGLASLTSGTDFLDSNSANAVLSSLTQVSTTLRSEASNLGSNLSIVQIRQDFSKNLINVLQTGASNLTLADTNEEAANSQALSTRQSIAVSALALANQSQQSVLQLLR